MVEYMIKATPSSHQTLCPSLEDTQPATHYSNSTNVVIVGLQEYTEYTVIINAIHNLSSLIASDSLELTTLSTGKTT